MEGFKGMIHTEAWYKETSHPITQAILEVRQELLNEGRVECLYDIGSGHCDDLADGVLQKLEGHPEASELSEAIMANFSLPTEHGDTEGPFIFNVEKLPLMWANPNPPPGWTWDELNKVTFGDHIFLWDYATKRFYDAEAPEGVDSPLDLPFFQRYLEDYRYRRGPGEGNPWERDRNRSMQDKT